MYVLNLSNCTVAATIAPIFDIYGFKEVLSI